jgi:prepilin-type N-terminal cleavage/methylation domain-containing protein
MKARPISGGTGSRRGGFTLIEVMLASVMAAMILVAVYTVFSRAINLRDNATQRMRAYQLRSRASKTIRDDLRNCWISGGVLASVLESSTSGSDGLSDSAQGGYLKFTTTTGKDTDDNLYGDVQQVEYYIAKDGNSGSAQSGKLVRVLTRDLLDNTTQQSEDEELVLAGVQSFTVTFWDGTTWQDSWNFSTTALQAAASSNSANSSTASTSSSTGGITSGTTSTTLPEAIRIDIQQVAPSAKDGLPPPLEIMVPLTAQPFIPLPTPS